VKPLIGLCVCFIENERIFAFVSGSVCTVTLTIEISTQKKHLSLPVEISPGFESGSDFWCCVRNWKVCCFIPSRLEE